MAGGGGNGGRENFSSCYTMDKDKEEERRKYLIIEIISVSGRLIGCILQKEP